MSGPRGSTPPAGTAGRTRVKICGITRAADARAALDAGADLLGFVLAESPRRLTPERVRVIREEEDVPAERSVVVLIDPSDEELAVAIARSGAGLVQLHGSEPPERCARSPVPVIKAFRVGEGWPAASLDLYPTWGHLLDARSPRGAGGTGVCFDWTAVGRALGARGASASSQPPAADAAKPLLFLAGGLTPKTVALGMRVLAPDVVDVSSGVERTPGMKDAKKIRAFIAAVRAADASDPAAAPPAFLHDPGPGGRA